MEFNRNHPLYPKIYRNEQIICPHCFQAVKEKTHVEAVKIELKEMEAHQDWASFKEGPQEPLRFKCDYCERYFFCFVSINYEFSTFVCEEESINNQKN